MAERTRNLVLVYEPARMDFADFKQIRARIHSRAPDIEVFVISNAAPATSEARRAAERPLLVVSPTRLRQYRPERGRIYAGKRLPKEGEMARLAERGVPVPRTALLTPDATFEPGEWGPYVLVKPTARGSQSTGAGVQAMRTERLRHIAPEDYPPGHPGRKGPMLVQQFIDTGPCPRHYRIMTLFGEPLVAYYSELVDERPPLDAPDAVLESACVATNGGRRRRVFFKDDDILAMARRAYEAVPEIPLQGCDILRDARTGALYVIEINAGGNTWHFSSPMGARAREEFGSADPMVGQFGAFDVAARVLIDRTRREAE
ncbi:hypothetical protein HW532_03170 [Kaustia mangrovi]|uniref:ATP-grasp domain-containing protein n=1 Tax=Kaustia mangrovi TaxID=2593653 RepID=A0A7S8C1T6_9HYPH|nr:hypothetical protein [Kaustia mangrovi]QPC41799.1 hypothetical protein HW532_03170 [Kaustia mangrovi]